MMRRFFSLMFIAAVAGSSAAMAQQSPAAFNAAKLQVKWQVLQNSYQGKSQFQSALTIVNGSAAALPASGWKIYFNFPRQVVPATVKGPVTIEPVNGDLFVMTPRTDFKALAQGDSIRTEFLAGAWALNITDGPDGFYYVADNSPQSAVAIPDSKILPVPDALMYRTGADKVPPVTPAMVYKRNKDITDIPADELPPILPTPLSLQKNGATFLLSANTVVNADLSFYPEAAYLKAELAALVGVANPLTVKTGDIVLTRDASLSGEAYKLVIDKHHIVISASDGAGIFYGIQSLRNLLPAKAWAAKQKSIAMPGMVVTDKPRFPYRGLMLDVARNFQSKQQVLKVIDLMGLYKLNKLHFHITDDEGWRIEIPGIPELTTIGAKRGHTLNNADRLQPAYGSGPNVVNTYGSGFYTRADFIEILRYAKARHISVIPEIETPGHARAAVKAMDARYSRLMQGADTLAAQQYLLRDVNDKSAYRSVQHWNDNVMDVGLPSTYTFLTKVVDEVVKMYAEAGASLETIHMGGDEVPAGVWQSSPAVQKLMADNNGIKTTDDLWQYYYNRVGEILRKHNLYTSAWEEGGMKKVLVNNVRKQVPNPDFAAQNMHLYVWNNVLGAGAEDLAYQLANAGFPVILSCVSNLYLDMAYYKAFDEPGYYWGGYVDVEEPFKFIPTNYLKNSQTNSMGSPMPQSLIDSKMKPSAEGMKNITGIQGQLWSEAIHFPGRLEYMLLPKMLGLAERAWAADPAWATEADTAICKQLYQQSWQAFVNVLGKRELPRLDYLNKGFQYRIPTAGIVVENGIVKANTQFPGMVIRYSIGDAEPTPTSPAYIAPLTVKGKINFRVFNSKGRGGRTVSVIN